MERSFFVECKENTVTFQQFAKINNINYGVLSLCKQVVDEFFNSVDVYHVEKVKDKVEQVIKLYFVYIEERTMKNGTKVLLGELSTKEYILFIWHFAGAVWQKIEVYDEDYNFYTRRIKLANILHKKIAEYFDVKKFAYLPF